MLIEQLQLENIGSYKDQNLFDLSVLSSKKNVILIGGENGAGKTTFLNSIRLGLFGSFGYGYKTENNEYYKRVYSYLNVAARKQENAPFSITITFSEVENYVRHTYVVKRSWQVNGQSVKERFMITKDGSILNEAEKDIYQSRLREFFPPKLFDLCLFDGEEIGRIISENKLSSYLQELSTVVFNLDLFNSLETDLVSYLQQAVDANKLSALEQEILALQQEEQKQLSVIQSLAEQMDHDIATIAELKETYISIKKDFETHGGLFQEERDQLNREMLAIEAERKQNSEKVREFIQTLLPFYLNSDLLFAAKEQIQNEENLSLFEKLSSEFTVERLERVTANLPGVSSANELAPQLREKLLQLVQPREFTVPYIHNVSAPQRIEIEVAVQRVAQERHKTYIRLIEQNRQMLTEAQELRQRMNTNDSAIEFMQMLQQMEHIKEETFQLEKSLEENSIKLEEMKQQLVLLQNTITAKQSTVEQGTKKRNSFIIAQNIMKLSTEFQTLQHQKKLQQVQIEATRMLNKLMRKHQYISAIRINPETFEVSLYDREREYITKETLSAGEKELLLLSLIWAMFKCSGRRVPFIFDTLLGRLDKTHKRNILVDFIPSCGEQVLILSTNSEVDEDHYELLQQHVSHRYLLEFHTDERKTYVSHQYFQFQEEGRTS